MADANAAASLERATDFGTDFATATLVVKAGANTLATHTVAGFTYANGVGGQADDGIATANAIADETITGAGTQTATTAELTAGTKTYVLTVGTDITLTTTTYINGETSSITGMVIRFPA